MEQWQDVPGYEGSYQVSNLGRVKSLARTVTRTNGRPMAYPEKVLALNGLSYGYLGVSLYRDGVQFTAKVHALVMLAFVGPYPEGMEINHIDGDKGNNRLENLEYVTHSQNIRHRNDVLGKHVRGERHPAHKLTDSDVLTIRQLSEAGTPNTEIAKRFGVHPITIGGIVNRKSRAHIYAL